MAEILKNWLHKYPNQEWLDDEKKISAYLKIIRKSPPIYLRPHDIISLNPMTRGYHEKDVEALIVWASLNGFSEFLIDIGANIGLTTCLAGKNFNKIYCYEPNILVRRILETNIAITFNDNLEKVKVFPFGFGNQEFCTTITIPKNNFGGAFILENNQYPKETLASKDGFKTFDMNNYLQTKIEVRTISSELAPIFNSNINTDEFLKGVIKIDVEGYELALLKDIYEVLPNKSEVLIIFENHLSGQSLEPTNIPPESIDLFEIIHSPLKGPRFLRKFKSKYLNATGSYFLKQVEYNQLSKGNIIGHIRKNHDLP